MTINTAKLDQRLKMAIAAIDKFTLSESQL